MVSGYMSYRQTAARTCRHLGTTPKDDSHLNIFTRQKSFSNTNTLRDQRILNGRISRWTIKRRRNNARFRASRPIKHLLLTICHNVAKLQWVHVHMGWNIRSLGRVHHVYSHPIENRPMLIDDNATSHTIGPVYCKNICNQRLYSFYICHSCHRI